MKQVIVSTTINPPTDAMERFASLPGWTVVVAGDCKTPAGYQLKNGIYLSYEDQQKIDRQLSDLIGPNCIQRRNFAFLYAYNELHADVIATIDDDNLPAADWGQELYLHTEADTAVYAAAGHCFDPLSVTNYRHLWHRGFPLQLLGQREAVLRHRLRTSFAVQASFWDGDPDVDAICRMEHAPDCTFDADVFPFTSEQVSPFNSQNTFLRREVLPYYFMFPKVGRMDDIWAAYFVQALGHRVVYTRPSVRQVRNVHNLTNDFLNELDGYVDAVRISEMAAARKPQQLLDCLPLVSRVAFRRYQTLFR